MFNDQMLTTSVARALEEEAGIARSSVRRAKPRVLVAISDEGAAGAVGGWLSGAGYDVTVVFSSDSARREPGSFECGVIADELSDGCGRRLALELSARGRLKRVLMRARGQLPSESAEAREDDDWALAEELLELETKVAGAVLAARAEEKPRRSRAA